MTMDLNGQRREYYYEGYDLELLSTEDSSTLKRILSHSAFIHGLSHKSYLVSALRSMNQNLSQYNVQIFYGIRLDTCANRSSLISNPQYQSYTKQFGLKNLIRPSTKKNIQVICGRRQTTYLLRSNIPFSDLGIIIYVYFTIIKKDVPTFFSIMDMGENKLDVSLLENYISNE